MKKLKFLLAGLLIASAIAPVAAQKITSGNLDFLKGETELNVVFDWSNVRLTKEKLTEEQFINKKTEARNEKEAGSGDTFAEDWQNDKAEFYHAKFIELYNDVLAKKNVKAAENSDAKYTLVVEPTYIFFGHNIGISKIPAYVNFKFTWKDSKTGKVLCTEILENVQGSQVMGFDFDETARVKESFALAAKKLAKQVYKVIKKS